MADAPTKGHYVKIAGACVLMLPMVAFIITGLYYNIKARQAARAKY